MPDTTVQVPFPLPLDLAVALSAVFTQQPNPARFLDPYIGETHMAVRLYVDFNTMTTDPKERVYINPHIHSALAQKLHPGLVVTLYDEEMEVEAVVEFDAHDQAWLGQPDWSTRRDLPLPSNNDARPA